MTQFNEAGSVSESEKPKKCTCKCRIIGIAILVVLIAGVVCWHAHRPKPIDPEITPAIDLKPGLICTVQFRRDVLGTAGDLPVDPTTNKINGAIVSLRGKLIAIDREAILLDWYHDRMNVYRRLWIPKDSILLIEYDPPNT